LNLCGHDIGCRSVVVLSKLSTLAVSQYNTTTNSVNDWLEPKMDFTNWKDELVIAAERFLRDLLVSTLETNL
jgi:hypothetical protein